MLERRNEFWPAIGIAAVINRVRADENVRRAEDLAPGESVGEEDRVARGDVGDRNIHFVLCPAIFRHGNVIRQRRTAENAEIDSSNTVVADARTSSHASSGVQFELMALAVIERQRVYFVSVTKCDRECRRRIEAAA